MINTNNNRLFNKDLRRRIAFFCALLMTMNLITNTAPPLVSVADTNSDSDYNVSEDFGESENEDNSENDDDRGTSGEENSDNSDASGSDEKNNDSGDEKSEDNEDNSGNGSESTDNADDANDYSEDASNKSDGELEAEENNSSTENESQDKTENTISEDGEVAPENGRRLRGKRLEVTELSAGQTGLLLPRQLKKRRRCGSIVNEKMEFQVCDERGDNHMPVKIERDHWHPGFLGAMEIEFRSYRNNLDFDDEHTLSKEPIKMDLLVIKKDKSIVITNQIGDIFRGHNVLEYKSPDDGITIDDYYKTMAYAYLYKGLGKTVDEIPGEELTVTMARDVHPDALFDRIKSSGGTVEQKYPGVYYVSGIFNTPSQILVTSELDPELHASLRILTKRAKEADVENFLRMAQGFTEPGDRQNADAVLQLSVSANRSVYEEIKRRDPVMCEALRDLMKEEIQEENQKAVDIATIAMIKSAMKTFGLDASKAMESLSIPEADQIRYASKL